MKILTVDVGTGTQDIFLYDSRVDLENGFKLVVPSPTMMVHHQIQAATQRGKDILLTGVLMGGGPSQWAAEAHAKAGYAVYATPDAARSFNDDLDKVAEMGIKVVSEDEAIKLSSKTQVIELRDFDFKAIREAMGVFGVSLENLDAAAVAVFDHGDAPKDMSDRQFRFDYLHECLQFVGPGKHPLSGFAFPSAEVPEIMTRLRAVVLSAQNDSAFPDGLPLVVMDTAPAAVLGATFDPRVGSRERVMIANVGNFHTLAFRLGRGGRVEGVFEHHTGLLDLAGLEDLLVRLADGSLRHEDVFDHHGHGALVYDQAPLDLAKGDFGLAVTGPRRGMMMGSRLRPYFAVPFGDMMIAGCFGLLAAVGDIMPETRETVRASLSGGGGAGTPPWEL
jgi:uncharacterized protein (DUF1786 family)